MKSEAFSSVGLQQDVQSIRRGRPDDSVTSGAIESVTDTDRSVSATLDEPEPVSGILGSLQCHWGQVLWF